MMKMQGKDKAADRGVRAGRSAGVLAGLLVGLGGVAAKADPLSICRAGNPGFPQLCECAVARSEAAGITGPVLDALLANAWDGVPLDVSTRYGLIFVECTQAAVAGGASVVPDPAPGPAPEPPVAEGTVTDAPVAEEAVASETPAPPPQTPPQTPPQDDRLAGVPGGYRISVEAAPGQWARGALAFPGGGSLVQAVRNDAGRHLALACAGDPPILILGPFAEGVPSQGAQVVVRGRGGLDGRIFQQGARLQAFNRDHLALGGISQALFDALRRGDTLEVQLEVSGTEAFALKGSSRALADSGCRIGRSPDWLYPLGWNATRHDPWQVAQSMQDTGPAPALVLPAVFGVVPHLALSCDRRLVSQSRVSAYDGTLTGEMVLRRRGAEDVTLSVTFDVRGFSARSDVLSPDVLETMAGAETMSLTFDVNAEPGAFVTIETTMAGFAAGLRGLACPAAPGVPHPGGGRDLTGAATWQVERITSFTDTPYYTASYIVPGAPKLFVTCKGTPSVLEGFTPADPGPRLALRLVVDEDPGRTRDSDFIYYRGGPANMGAGHETVGPWILAGETLRITNLDDPSESFVYPLSGLRDAVASMPPPCEF